MITDKIALVLENKDVRTVLSIAPERSVYEALEMMAEHDIGALLVISDDRVIGILSERDYARKCILLGHPSKSTRVSEIMTRTVVSVSPQQTVDECLALMTEHHFRHLPVLEGDAVIGVVSIGDLVKWVISGQAQHIEALEGYIAVSYPG